MATRKKKLSRGTGTTMVSISLPHADLAELDRFARRCQMTRTGFLRQAYKHFGAHLFPDGVLK